MYSKSQADSTVHTSFCVFRCYKHHCIGYSILLHPASAQASWAGVASCGGGGASCGGDGYIQLPPAVQ